MNNDSTKLTKEDRIRYERIYGVHVDLSGGEEDSTIRPTILSPETLKAMKESCPPAENFNGTTDQKFPSKDSVE